MIAAPIVGLMLGTAAAIVLGILRPRVKSRQSAEENIGLPVLATVPLLRDREVARDPFTVQQESAWGAEEIRKLVGEIEIFEKRNSHVGVIVVASPQPRDGRSTLAANLAASYSGTGRSVALLRADKHRRHLDTAYSLSPSHDLGDDQESLNVRVNRRGFIEMIPTSPQSELPNGTGIDMPGIVAKLSGRFDVVIVDTRPLLASADSLTMARQANAVLLVLRQFKTSELEASAALEVLTRHGAPVVGSVLNGFRLGLGERYRHRLRKRSRSSREPAPSHEPRREPPHEPSPPAESLLSARETASSRESILSAPRRVEPSNASPSRESVPVTPGPGAGEVRAGPGAVESSPTTPLDPSPVSAPPVRVHQVSLDAPASPYQSPSQRPASELPSGNGREKEDSLVTPARAAGQSPLAPAEESPRP